MRHMPAFDGAPHIIILRQ